MSVRRMPNREALSFVFFSEMINLSGLSLSVRATYFAREGNPAMRWVSLSFAGRLKAICWAVKFDLSSIDTGKTPQELG
jgi:hypothetical protein